MKFYLILFSMFFLSYYSYGQGFLKGQGQGVSKEYLEYVNKAESFLEKKEYSASAFNYSKAFEANNGLGKIQDRYKAACCWALLNNNDSAFYQLFRIIKVPTYTEYEKFESEKALVSLHSDIRWNTVINKLKFNRENIEIILQNPDMQQ
jgi:hypothetical protein